MAQVTEVATFVVAKRTPGSDTMEIMATEPRLQDAMARAELLCENAAECRWDRVADRRWVYLKSRPMLEIIKQVDTSGMP